MVAEKIELENLNLKMVETISVVERNGLSELSKEELMETVVQLKGELNKVKDDFIKLTNLRLYHLERNFNLQAQYGRRESFEIVGIPPEIDDEKLEDEVIEIAKEAKISVNRQPLKKQDICAVHRLRDRKTTIVRVANRKYAQQAILEET